MIVKVGHSLVWSGAVEIVHELNPHNVIGRVANLAAPSRVRRHDESLVIPIDVGLAHEDGYWGEVGVAFEVEINLKGEEIGASGRDRTVVIL